MNHVPATESQRKARPNIDHVARIIDQYYTVRGTELMVDSVPVSELVEQFGSPLFVYDQSVILKKIDEVRALLPAPFQLYYSIKANPNATILKLCLQQGCGLEIASGGELYQALQAGCPPDRLIFAGPGKTRDELAAALHAGIREIHVESIEEARCINELAGADAHVAKVALRVNPTDAAGGAMRMGGKASPFGIDEETLDSVLDEILTLSSLKVVGVHLFMGTQILDAATLINQYQRAVEIARRVASRLPHSLATIDFGGGLGTPFFPHESPLDLRQAAEGVAQIAQQLTTDPLLRSATAIMEPGRFLVNEAGIYLSRVTRVKQSRGKTFAVIDGGMHHHLAASGNLGQTIKRNFPVAVVNKIGLSSKQPVDVVGPLCTPLDCLARGVELPPVEAGDLIGVFQSGAYARTASPHGFLSHNTPAEVLVVDGQGKLIRRRGQPQDYLRDQADPNAAATAGATSHA
jgi:diaminopimelate decarboxylase